MFTMELIDNKQGRTVESEITKRIDTGTSVSVSTGMFSIYAFYFLRDKFKNIKELNILLLNNSFSKYPLGLSFTSEDAFWGTTAERELKRKLLLRHASEECSRIFEKSTIRSLLSSNAFGFKLIFILNNRTECVINNGMADFDSATLGLINSDDSQYHILQEGNENVLPLKIIFNNVWNDQSKSKNITESILAELKKGYKDYTPDFLYHFILHHLFHYAIVEFADEKIIKTKTGFKEKEI